VKEHALDPNDRAALQSLVTLSGTIGIGTIFGLAFAGKRTQLSVFAIFAAASVFVLAGATAVIAINLLHDGQALGDHEFAQTATPLIIAGWLLIFVTASARIAELVSGFGTMVLLAGLGVVAALEVGSTTLTAEPDEAFEIAVRIIAIGVALALLLWGWERFLDRGSRRSSYKHLVALAGLGFVPAEASPGPSLPRSGESPAPPRLSGWERKGRFHLDTVGALELASLVRGCWDEVCKAEATLPADELILVDVEPPTTLRLLTKKKDLVVLTFSPADEGREHRVRFARGAAGTYDVTDLVRLG
jgi:hypothetical protein